MELPLEFTKRMKEMLADEYDSFMRAFTSTKENVAVRINTMKDTDGVVKEKLDLYDQVPWCKDGFYTEKEKISGKHPYHIAGLLYFQEPSAMAPVEALTIAEESRVLDLCAAPGGKTTQIAMKLKNTGLVVSNEIIPKRAKILAENVSRLGLKNVVVTNETPERLSEKYTGFFDVVIVDAPCSGEGMFRKEEQAAVCWSVAHTRSCGMRQKNIVDSAMKCLVQGGQLLYSTCTFAPEENEEVAAYILDKYPFMRLENPHSLSMLRDGIMGMTGAKRIYPHLQRGEGHFIALFKDTRPYKTKTILEKKSTADLGLYRKFEREFLNVTLTGNAQAFGDNLYLLPSCVDIDKIKVVYAGLHLGIYRKNRFEPSHSLCLALKKQDFKNSVSFSMSSDNLKKYLAGECIFGDKVGWTAICVDEFPIGWGKASSGVLKNHFPKQFRMQ